jgi:hypothetical protein
MRKGFGTQRQSLPPLIHILRSKIRASSGLVRRRTHRLLVNADVASSAKVIC